MGERGRSDRTVVVPAVGAASSTTSIRSLGSRGIRTVAISADETPPAFCSRYCHESMRVLSPREDLRSYTEQLLALAKRDDVRAILPIQEEDVYVLSKHRDEFASHVAPLWPSFETLSVAHDREKLFSAAERLDVPVPRTSLLSEIDDWSRELIVKGRYAILTAEYGGTNGTNTVGAPPKTIYLEPGDDPDVQDIRAKMGHDPLAQEYVRGTEYTFRALYDHGEPVVTTQKELVRGYKYPRGPSVSHRAVRIPELEAVGRRLLDGLEWHGLASVGFIRDEASGEFKLLEINPRFWASLPMDVHAGIDYPYQYWCLATDTAADSDSEYEPGTVSHLLRGQFAHLYSVFTDDYPLARRPSAAKSVWDIASSLSAHRHFDLFSTDDPGPFVRDLLNTVSETTG
jgi:predicted ATP-grasp superfamily ATP-dependent carboligase